MASVIQDAGGAGTLPPLNLPDFTASGAIGTAAATVDTNVNQITLNQSTALVSLTVPAPTIATNYKVIDFQNIGTVDVSLSFFGGASGTLLAKGVIRGAWNGANWAIVNSSSPVTESGQATVAATIGVNSGTFNSAATSILVTSFTLPSAGTWDVTVDLSGNNGNYATGGSSTTLKAALFLASAPTAIIGPEYQQLICRAQAGGTSQTIGFGQSTRTYRITTAGSTAYQVRAWSTGVSGSSIEPTSGGDGSSQVNWVKVAGNVPVTGQSAEYLNVIASVSQTTGIAVGSPILFNTPVSQGTIPFSAGIFTLQAGKTYQVEGSGGQCLGGTPLVQWRNITSGALIGLCQFVNTGSFATSVLAQATITPLVTTTVRLEILNVNACTSIGANDSNGNRMPYATITQIGSTATIGFVGSNGTIAGQGGTVPAPAIADNLKFLRGNGTWASALPKVTTFTTNGTFTRDPLSTYAIAEFVGGGGNGGYGFGTAGANTAYIGLGGASGAYVKVLLTAIQMGASQTVTIGAAGGATSLGSLATANGGATGAGIYVNSDLVLTSCTLTSPQARATFSITTGLDLGSKLGNLALDGFVSNGTGRCCVVISDGADSEMGRGARGIRSTTYPQYLTSVGAYLAQAAGANTGGGASGDSTYSPTASAGVASASAVGGTGFMRITEYYN